MADDAFTTPPSVLTLADLNTTVNHEPRVEDLRLAEALGMERPRNVRKLIERHREALERFGGICSTVERNPGRGRPGRTFWLNKRQALYLCTKSETPRATEVTIGMVEVFDAYQAGRLDSTVLVKAHRRALPKPKAPVNLRRGHALIQVGRETVLVDMANFHPGEGERAVLLDFSGNIFLDKAVCHYPHQNWYGRRIGHVLTATREDDRSLYKTGWIIGTVIGPKVAKSARGKEASGSRVVATTKPRRAMLPPPRVLPDLTSAVTLGAA